MKFFPLLWGNLKRRKLRTSLTLLSILVAFVLFGLLCAIREALAGGVDMAGADRLVVRHKVSIIQLLPESYRARMERLDGIALAVHQTWFGGMYQDPRNFFMQSPVEPEPFLEIFPEIVLPADQKEAWVKTRTGAIVGRATAERFDWQIGDRVPIQSSIWPKEDGSRVWEFDIVGIYDGREPGTDTTSLYFRYDYFDEARPDGKGLVGWYSIRVDDPERAAEIGALVDKEFENSSAETKTEPEGAFVQAWVDQIGNIVLIVAGIMGAVFFTILLVAGNTMAQAVRERLGELGVLKALGFTNERILVLILGEACALSLVGGGIGLGLAMLFVSGGDPTGGMLPLFRLPTQDVLLGIAISLALGLAAGILPALQAMRLRPADAIRRM